MSQGRQDALLTCGPAVVRAVDIGLAQELAARDGEQQRSIRVFQFAHDEDDMREVLAGRVDRVASGRVRLVLAHVYPFDQALCALEKTETRHARARWL